MFAADDAVVVGGAAAPAAVVNLAGIVSTVLALSNPLLSAKSLAKHFETPTPPLFLSHTQFPLHRLHELILHSLTNLVSCSVDSIGSVLAIAFVCNGNKSVGRRSFCGSCVSLMVGGIWSIVVVTHFVSVGKLVEIMSLCV